MAEKTIRWGILSTGKISQAFAAALQETEGAALVAVGSRTQESADQFGDAFNVPRRHSTYERLAADPNVDVIYIGTPHSFHHQNTLLCLNQGKAVLCEKAFAMTAAEAAEMIAVARRKHLFLMEAMWTRYLPIFVRLRQLLAEKAIGELQYLAADFGFHAPYDPKHRLFAPDLGGGALLDVGIYPLSLASMLFGKPDEIYTTTRLGKTGVDEQTGIMLSYSGGRMANLFASTRLRTPTEAMIAGDKGFIRIHSRFHQSEAMTLYRDGEEAQFIAAPHDGSGYRFEAAEVVRCLREGLLESPLMPLDETLELMRTMDAIQAVWRTPPQDFEAPTRPHMGADPGTP